MLWSRPMFAAAVFFAALLEPAPLPAMGACAAPGAARAHWPRALRRETRERVQAIARGEGASETIVRYADAVVMRESSGDAHVRHTQGEGEDGVGPMGLSLRWHASKWPGSPDPDWCQPEASYEVARVVWRRAIEHYGATNVAEIQAIFGGHWVCERPAPSWWRTIPGLAWLADLHDRNLDCEPLLPPKSTAALCKRMRDRGASCWTRVTVDDLGTPTPKHRRREIAFGYAARFGS